MWSALWELSRVGDRGAPEPVRTHAGIRERGFGVFEGLTRDECISQQPEAWNRYVADRTLAPPDAEPPVNIAARMVAGLEDILRKTHPQKALEKHLEKQRLDEGADRGTGAKVPRQPSGGTPMGGPGGDCPTAKTTTSWWFPMGALRILLKEIGWPNIPPIENATVFRLNVFWDKDAKSLGARWFPFTGCRLAAGWS